MAVQTLPCWCWYCLLSFSFYAAVSFPNSIFNNPNLDQIQVISYFCSIRSLLNDLQNFPFLGFLFFFLGLISSSSNFTFPHCKLLLNFVSLIEFSFLWYGYLFNFIKIWEIWEFVDGFSIRFPSFFFFTQLGLIWLLNFGLFLIFIQFWIIELIPSSKKVF